VLSDNQGAIGSRTGSGRLSGAIRARAYQADTVKAMALTPDQNAAQDFALKASYVRWTDISMYQGIQLLPEARARTCSSFIACVSRLRDPHGGRQAQRGWLARSGGLHAEAMAYSLRGRSSASMTRRPRTRLLLHSSP